MNDLPRVPRTINGKVVMVALCPPRAASGVLPFSLSPIADDGAAGSSLARRQGPIEGDAEHLAF
jgi:hypothetical protein